MRRPRTARWSVGRGGSPAPVRWIAGLFAAIALVAACNPAPVSPVPPVETPDGTSGGAPSSVPVLAYHGITTDTDVVTDEADPRYYDARLPAFEEQMRALHDAGYRSITPAEYVAWVRGEAVHLPDKPILITFDDGQASTSLATPVLQQYGFQAVMYVVSGFADGAFGGPSGEPGWYLTWDQLKDMKASGAWLMQFHAGPRGHAYVADARDPDCHRFYPCHFGEDDATYRARVKSDVAQGLGAMRSAFGLPAGWTGSTFAVPWDDASTSDDAPDPWLPAYFADQFAVVFVQDSYTGTANHQRYRYEIHNPATLAAFRAALTDPRFGA